MRRVNLHGKLVILRALEPEDLDVMYVWENDISTWESSNTRAPYSRHELRQFIESSSQDMLTTQGQQRFVICLISRVDFRGEELAVAGESVGMIDIFDYDSRNHRAGVGVYIDPLWRGNGYAKDALLRLEKHFFSEFELHQLWCGVAQSNVQSLELFQRAGYELIGVRKEWLKRAEGYENELIYQKIL